ncbi:22.3 kDa class VI heat shock [Musa troglodytarum]|uniref:22.3 kDa class VI heat shock n=2 Tax=Musa troglodytarum TaxID=320322 RepID=A0A9E7LCP3_9LILI|nr:22.3 kDa class VI heat shock [Musa troglodytarum]
MAPPRVIEVRSGDQSLHSQKWRVALTEDAFDRFVACGGGAAAKVFGEGSLFSLLLFGKFFDPADAFPLWEFEAETLLSGPGNASKTAVDWSETDSVCSESRATRKCDVEICGVKEKVVELSGLWGGREADAREWKAGRWWEHGFVRRLELPPDANWKKTEAYINDDIFLEIKIPKTASGSKSLISFCSCKKRVGDGLHHRAVLIELWSSVLTVCRISIEG